MPDDLANFPTGIMGDADDPEPTVAFHGTPLPEKVLAEGLRASMAQSVNDCEHVWLALHAEDAAHYGTVIEVDLSYLDGTWPRDSGPLDWQACYHGGDIPPQALCLADLKS